MRCGSRRRPRRGRRARLGRVPQDVRRPWPPRLRAHRAPLDLHRGPGGPPSRSVVRSSVVPEQVTTAWWKEERGGEVFVDYNQAARDRTIARRTASAQCACDVSTPLRWDELPDVRPATSPYDRARQVRRTRRPVVGDRRRRPSPRRCWSGPSATRPTGPGRHAVSAGLSEDARRAPAGAAVEKSGVRRGRLVMLLTQVEGQPHLHRGMKVDAGPMGFVT